jgi:hypothetical protein
MAADGSAERASASAAPVTSVWILAGQPSASWSLPSTSTRQPGFTVATTWP